MLLIILPLQRLQLEALQAEGSLEVARPKDQPPPPSFERWAFAEPHYVQYLEDLYTVHAALEEALGKLKLIEAQDAALSSLSAGDDSDLEIQGMQTLVINRCQLFGSNNEIARSSALSQDLAQIRASSDAAEKLLFGPSPNAAAYAQAIEQIGVQYTRAENEKERTLLAVKIAANAYVNMLVFLTGGTRIGAAATEKLGLFKRGAVHTFVDYSKLDAPPLGLFRAAVDQLGLALNFEQQDAFLKELPVAMRRTSVLLEALAKDKE